MTAATLSARLQRMLADDPLKHHLVFHRGEDLDYMDAEIVAGLMDATGATAGPLDRDLWSVSMDGALHLHCADMLRALPLPAHIRFRIRGRFVEDEFVLRVEDDSERGPVVAFDGGPRRWRRDQP